MFKRLEAWLRRIISEELSKVETSLADERSLLTSAISVHVKASLNEVEAEFIKLTSNLKTEVAFKTSEVEGFAKQIEAVCDSCVANFRQRLEQSLHDVMKDEPSQWKADADDVKADHLLRNAAPLKKRKP